jgi:hypothetical protein
MILIPIGFQETPKGGFLNNAIAVHLIPRSWIGILRFLIKLGGRIIQILVIKTRLHQFFNPIRLLQGALLETSIKK